MCGLQAASVNQASPANQTLEYALQLCLQLIRIGYWPLLTYVGHISSANHSSSLSVPMSGSLGGPGPGESLRLSPGCTKTLSLFFQNHGATDPFFLVLATIPLLTSWFLPVLFLPALQPKQPYQKCA